MDDRSKLTIIHNDSKFYARNQALLKAVKHSFPNSADLTSGKGVFKNLRLILYFFSQKSVTKILFYVWPASHLALSILAAKLMGKRVIYDAFTSMYDSLVNDRKIVKPGSIKSLFYYLQDYFCCRLADKIIFDTQGHKEYFFETFIIKSSKRFIILPVSIDLDFIDQQPALKTNTSNLVNILFYGSFIPLQGIEYILKTVQLTKDLPVRYTLIGNGQTHKRMVELAKNLQINEQVAFIPSVPYTELISQIKAADICLGIFGDTLKAQRVIPNKVLECAACGKPVITGKNNDMAEFFRDKESILFCPMADAQALSEKIRWAVSHRDQWRSLGQKARETVGAHFSLSTLADKIKNNLI